ncbi:MFS transporter [Marinivivus vitaminiproducens]|uniref:MFS transporter n=1 Tax=Marinivivus vitaminiproducens TaxID=3035935 RepID=UPI00279CDC25|nr:MFS transporter [Geminicoccaceae bacterium SCSIO 64248]
MERTERDIEEDDSLENDIVERLAAEAGPVAGTEAAAPPSALTAFLTLFPSIFLPMFLAVIDQTIVAAALPSIAASVGNVHQISWVVVAYLLTATVAAPVYGRLGDLLGRRRLMLIALCVVLAGSLLCAIADTLPVLVLGRIVQGLGGGGLMTLTQALVGEVVAPRDRPRYQGFLAAVAVSASTFGPVAGGYLTEHLGWRSIFYLNIPLTLVALALALRLPNRLDSRREFRFDVKGMFLFATAVIAALLALNTLQTPTAETLPLVGALMAGAVVAAWLLFHEERRASVPLFPLDLLRAPSIWRSDALAFCHGAVLVGLVTVMPIYLRVVLGASASEIGLLMLPMTAGVGIGSILTGQAAGRSGRTAIYPSIGLIGATATLLILALYAHALDRAQMAVLLGVNSLFMGTVMGIVQVTVQVAAGPGMLGAASGSVQFSRSVGAAFGTALAMAVLFLTLAVGDPAAAAAFTDSVAQAHTAAATALAGPVMDTIQVAFRNAFLAITAFSVAALALAWTLPLRRL